MAPKSVIIVGAGIFGLSTALAIARRHPSTQVTIVDRMTPPVPDGTSVDTTRCIRADYGDPIYAHLAFQAQKMIEADPQLQPHYFKQGMSFIVDAKDAGPAQKFLANGMAQVRAQHGAESVVEMKDAGAVYRRIHGQDSQLPSPKSLGRERRWTLGYCNLEDAFIDAEESVRVYYQRCLAQRSISFRCGVPVDRLCISQNRATGVVLENGEIVQADLTVVAAGAWSNKLVHLEGLMMSSAIEVAWIKLTDDEVSKWKNMSITTNLSTGFNLFPPHKGEMKCLRRSAGYKNTVSVPHPDDPSRTVKASLPRTMITNPGDSIPLEAEAALRDNLRELMPTLADRPFDRTKLCWLAQTPSSDFIIAPHPHVSGIHVATGGSAHAWKFLPIIGDLVLDSIEGNLRKELVDKWAWSKKGSDEGNSPRMKGDAKELRDFVRSHL